MIKFDNVDEYSKKYNFYYDIIKYMHHTRFYNKVIVKGLENVPPKGEAVFMIPNHQNGVMDALAVLLMFSDRRQPVFIARGDVFKNPKIAKFLRFVKIMPTFRTRDGGRKDIEKNNEIFDIAAKILNRGGTLCIFPEAMHQHGRYLGTYKKGFPRIAFAAEEMGNYDLKLKIMPVSIHYSHYEHCKSDLYLNIGETFTLEEFVELYKNEPNKAYNAFNEKARSAHKALLLDIEDRDHYEELDLFRAVYSNDQERKRNAKLRLDERHAIEKKCIANVLEERNSDPEKYQKRVDLLKEYKELLDKNNFRDKLVGKNHSFVGLLLKLILLILGLPLFLFAALANSLAYYLPELLISKVKDHQLHSSVRYILYILLFPIWYILLFVISWIVSGQLLFALGLIAAAIVTVSFIFRYKVAFIKMKNAFRYLFNKNSKTVQRLETLRKEILDTIS